MFKKNNLIKLCLAVFFIQHAKAQCEENIILEVNPLLLINQGIGLNSEFAFIDNYSVGFNLEYFRQNPYMANGVTANRYIYTAAPFLHYYFFTNKMFGPFIGAKINLTYSQSSISDSDTNIQYNIFYAAPILQAGYRFRSESGFTLSAYIGIGYKSKKDTFDNSAFPNSKSDNLDWKLANEKLHKNVTQLQPDYGLTLGYLF
ncbi:DUF3575 domain-containing protein [Silvanigrella sp.]|jgi:hypothetical protein|uniref:DUF3575 domain-containing protein n=1 Tax=Silvanigrella sp. TaxID=2024976 RepID=UPI0037C76186